MRAIFTPNIYVLISDLRLLNSVSLIANERAGPETFFPQLCKLSNLFFPHGQHTDANGKSINLS